MKILKSLFEKTKSFFSTADQARGKARLPKRSSGAYTGGVDLKIVPWCEEDRAKAELLQSLLNSVMENVAMSSHVPPMQVEKILSSLRKQKKEISVICPSRKLGLKSFKRGLRKTSLRLAMNSSLTQSPTRKKTKIALLKQQLQEGKISSSK